MHPAFLDNLSWEMAEVYGAITDQIMINLSRHFPYFQTGEPVPTSAFAYQAKMLAQMGQVNAETLRIIRNGLEDADLALQGALEQAIIDAVRTTEPELLDAVKQGILRPAGMPTVSPNQYRAFNLYYTQSADKLNLVNTVMLESTNSAYQQTIADVVSEIELAERINATYTALDVASGEVVTGVSSWNQALRHATDRMKNRGITGFIDHAGRHWSAEAYAAMDIRTTMFNTGRAAVWETNQNFGNDLYSVSYHNGARPLCYPYQNKVISSTDHARTVVDLDGNEVEVLAQSATSYGQPAGLFGINCKHYPTPFIPGVSVIEGQPQDKEANDKTYAESQEQRRLERNVRERKRDVLMAKAQGAPPEEIAELEAKAKASSEKVDEFCKATGRARHRDREAVYTKREFPGDGRYNVAEFKDTQQQIINNWYQQGGAQQNYTFGEMTQIEPVNEPADKLDETRKKAIEGYTGKIEELERKRIELISSGSEDYELSDKLYAETERLEKRKKIIEKGGFTTDQATVTKQPFVVAPGRGNEIVLQEATIYTMPDGKQFVFKSGMNRAHQSLTPEELIEAFYDMPQNLRKNSQDVIAVVDRYNPVDAQWRKQYKGFTHSYMTGGDHIVIYRYDYAHDPDYLRYALDHEVGHFADRANAINGIIASDTQEWINAMAQDKTFSGFDSITSYGTNARTEDFAESVANYVKDRDNFAKKMPNRARILDRLIGNGGAEP